MTNVCQLEDWHINSNNEPILTAIAKTLELRRKTSQKSARDCDRFIIIIIELPVQNQLYQLYPNIITYNQSKSILLILIWYWYSFMWLSINVSPSTKGFVPSIQVYNFATKIELDSDSDRYRYLHHIWVILFSTVEASGTRPTRRCHHHTQRR